MSNLNTFLSIKYQNNSCYAVCIFCKKKYYYNKKNEILSKQTILCKNICGPWPASCKSELLLKVNCRIKFKFAAQNFKEFSKKKNQSFFTLFLCTCYTSLNLLLFSVHIAKKNNVNFRLQEACPDVCGRRCRRRIRSCHGPYHLACSGQGKAEDFDNCPALNNPATTSFQR